MNLSHGSQHAELGSRSLSRRSEQGCVRRTGETRAQGDPCHELCSSECRSGSSGGNSEGGSQRFSAWFNADFYKIIQRMWWRSCSGLGFLHLVRFVSVTRSVETQLRDVNMSAGRNDGRTTLTCVRTRCLSVGIIVSGDCTRLVALIWTLSIQRPSLWVTGWRRSSSHCQNWVVKVSLWGNSIVWHIYATSDRVANWRVGITRLLVPRPM